MKLTDKIPSNETSYVVEYLKAGLKYKFKLQAENSIGLLSDNSTVQWMIASTLPSAPGIPTLIQQSSKLIKFSWSQPYDNGGSEIKEYKIVITRVTDN